MYLLARELTGSRGAAFAAGMYFAFGPLRMSQISHIQMVATGWMPVALWGLHRYFSTRRFRWLVVCVAAWVLQMLSNTYVGYFIAVPIVVVVADGVWRERTERTRVLTHLAVASLLARRRARAGGPRLLSRAHRLSPGAQRRRSGGRQRGPARVRRRQGQRRRLALAADGRQHRSRKRALPRRLRPVPRRDRLLERRSRSAAQTLGDRATASSQRRR